MTPRSRCHSMSLLTCMLVSVLLVLPENLQSERLPNIIYILADDLGFGDLSCYGQQTLRTPRLDGLARSGMRFTQHYAGSTVCAPSRCVLMTGLHTGHAQIRGNDKSLLRSQDITLAEVLKDAGYATGCVGKWGIGHPPPLDDPQRHGFDYFYGYVNMFHAHNFYPEWLVENGVKVKLRNSVYRDYDRPLEREGRGVASQKVDYAPELITQAGLRYIEEHRDEPFFLYFAMNIPHANNEAGGDVRAGKNGMEVPDHGSFAQKKWPDQEKGFARMIEIIDSDVGRILDRLDELGLAQNTLLLFSSDNGPHQEGGHKMTYFDSNGPLRGMKRDLYEGGIRVPLIAHWPGHIRPGVESDHISGFQDILPTLAEIAGKGVADTDGISFAPTLLADGGPQKKHPHLYWEFYEQGGKRAIRRGFWKAVQRNMLRSPNSPTELYDLSQDLEEKVDVSAQHPEMVTEMKRLMDASHNDRMDVGL